jgi:hypothetical protein
MCLRSVQMQWLSIEPEEPCFLRRGAVMVALRAKGAGTPPLPSQATLEDRKRVWRIASDGGGSQATAEDRKRRGRIASDGGGSQARVEDRKRGWRIASEGGGSKSEGGGSKSDGGGLKGNGGIGRRLGRGWKGGAVRGYWAVRFEMVGADLAENMGGGGGMGGGVKSPSIWAAKALAAGGNFTLNQVPPSLQRLEAAPTFFP